MTATSRRPLAASCVGRPSLRLVRAFQSTPEAREKPYCVVYTVTERDGTTRVGFQRFRSLMVARKFAARCTWYHQRARIVGPYGKIW